jgi:hypothetical protein
VYLNVVLGIEERTGMRSSLRTAAVALAAVAVLALAGSASAGITSAKITLSSASQALGGVGTKLKLTKSQADNDLARAVFYVPLGYQLSNSAVGTQLGTAAATVFARDLNAIVPVTGTVTVANPADFAAQATACTGTATHSQIWALNLQAAGTPLTVPAFVDTITAPPLSALALATITFCLPPSDIPQGTPGRATLGASVITAEFTTNALVNPGTAGSYRWRALVTPYQTANGKVDSAGTVEAQSIVNVPTTLTLTAKGKKGAAKGTYTVTYGGKLISNGQGVESATVDVLKGSTAKGVKKFKTQSTAAGAYSGSFTVRQAKKATFAYLVAKATTSDQDLGTTGCTATFVPPLSPVPIPCVDATVAGVSLTSSVVKVTIPAAPKKK